MCWRLVSCQLLVAISCCWLLSETTASNFFISSNLDPADGERTLETADTSSEFIGDGSSSLPGLGSPAGGKRATLHLKVSPIEVDLRTSLGSPFLEEAPSQKIVYTQPEQLHIAIGDNVSSVVVTWQTLSPTPTPTCRYGIGGLTSTARGKSRKFVDGGKTKVVRYIHSVQISHLVPSTRYLYHCGSTLGWSEEFWFTSLSNSTQTSVKLAVYGDLGNVNAKSLPYLQEETQRGEYDAILHVGDFAYDMFDVCEDPRTQFTGCTVSIPRHIEGKCGQHFARPWFFRNRKGQVPIYMSWNEGDVGDQFMRQIQPIAAYVPYMVSPGNHEEAYNFSHFRYRFNMPGDTENLYYDFKLGPVHFISLNTEAYYFVEYGIKIAIKQYMWLSQVLKEANKPENRAKWPWIITYGHRPMYCSDDDGDDCTKRSSRVRVGLPILEWFGLEKLFYDNGVDLEIWAHEHSYERLWPVYEHKVYNGSLESPYTNPEAPVHVITGSAGCQEFTDKFIKNPSEWSAFRNSDYGYSRVQIFNSSHLYWEQVSVDKEGDVIDSFWLIKDHHGPFGGNK